jgi:Tfp pilus assembly protein PilF
MRRTVLRISSVLVPLSLMACSAPAQKPAETARAQLKDTKLLVERGRAYGEMGDYTRAEQYLGAALSAGAKPEVVLPPLLNACVEAGHLRLASEYAERQLAREPNNTRLRFLTGALHAQLGNRATARKHLEQAAAELPTDPNVQFSVATFFRDDLHDVVEADAYFRGYLNIAPNGEHANEARASLMERVQ